MRNTRGVRGGSSPCIVLLPCRSTQLLSWQIRQLPLCVNLRSREQKTQGIRPSQGSMRPQNSRQGKEKSISQKRFFLLFSGVRILVRDDYSDVTCPTGSRLCCAVCPGGTCDAVPVASWIGRRPRVGRPDEEQEDRENEGRKRCSSM